MLPTCMHDNTCVTVNNMLLQLSGLIILIAASWWKKYMDFVIIYLNGALAVGEGDRKT